MRPNLRETLMLVALVALGSACTLVREPDEPNALDTGPVCVAFDAAGAKVECPAGSPDLLDGDSCTCTDSATGETSWGRIRGGM